MDISKAWGYGAVVIGKRLFWQGFVVLDPGRKDLAPSIEHAENVAKFAYQAAGHEPTSDQVFGALQSALVDCFVKKGMYSEGKAAVFSSAIARHSGQRFFVVAAAEEEGGTRTTFIPLEANTPETARDEVNRIVAPLKMGTIINLMKDPGHGSPSGR